MSDVEVRYEAAWTPDEQSVTVVRSVHAGISGPFGDYPATSREDAVVALRQAGYLVVGPWVVSSLGDHWTDLAHVAP